MKNSCFPFRFNLTLRSRRVTVKRNVTLAPKWSYNGCYVYVSRGGWSRRGTISPTASSVNDISVEEIDVPSGVVANNSFLITSLSAGHRGWSSTFGLHDRFSHRVRRSSLLDAFTNLPGYHLSKSFFNDLNALKICNLCLITLFLLILRQITE